MAADYADLTLTLPTGTPAETFMKLDEHDIAAWAVSNQLKFTKNMVVMEITGAPVNLTLIDL